MADGLMRVTDSPHTVGDTLDRVEKALHERGVPVFARVDHGGGARAAGLQLGDEEVLIFGDPRVGTALMQSDPRVGYELPLRVLAWQEQGGTRLGYVPASELAERYRLAGREEVLAKMDTLLAQLVAEGVAAGGAQRR